MGPVTRLPMGKNHIRVRVWVILPPTGVFVGHFLTHRVYSCVPLTRYPMGHPFQYDMWAIH
jgi:hypothetical protein